MARLCCIPLSRLRWAKRTSSRVLRSTFGFLRSELQVADNLHLLVIGYSAVDLEVLSLLRETSTPIKSFGIVNQDHETAQQVAGRLHDQTRKHLGDGWVWDSTFGGFVQRDGWDKYKHHLMSHL